MAVASSAFCQWCRLHRHSFDEARASKWDFFLNKINNLPWPAAATAAEMEWAAVESTWDCKGGIIVVSIFYENFTKMKYKLTKASPQLQQRRWQRRWQNWQPGHAEEGGIIAVSYFWIIFTWNKIKTYLFARQWHLFSVAMAAEQKWRRWQQWQQWLAKWEGGGIIALSFFK